MSQSMFYHVSEQGGFAQLSNIQEALQKVGQSGYIWLDFDNPSLEQIVSLIEPLGIHPLSVEDCFDNYQTPKFDIYPKNSFILFNSFSYENKILSINEVDFIFSSNFLVTVHGINASNNNFFNKLHEFIRKPTEKSNLFKSPDFLLHLILDFIVDAKFAGIETLQEELDEIEETILNENTVFKPEKLITLRKHLLSLRKSLFYEREILIRICRSDSLFISEKAVFYFRDIYDHLAKFFEYIEINRDMLSHLFELHISMINNRLAKISNHTNTVMRRLTAITTVFMPLTLLSGILGMSEWTMMVGPENWKWGFPLFLAISVILGGTNYYILKRLRWF